MAALTPPVFHPDAVRVLRDDVLKVVHDDLWSVNFSARHSGDEATVLATSARMDCVFNAGFWVDGFMPRLLVDRHTGAVIGVRRPHPLDEFYPPPPGTPGA